MGASLSVSGLADFQEEVRRMARRTANRQELYREAGEMMVNTEIPLIFRDEGPGWKPTLRGGKILQDKGTLMKASQYTVEPADLVIGVPANGPAGKYAPVHQYGATITAKKAKYLVFQVNGRWARKKSVTIPARPFLKWTERALRRIARRWADMVGGSATVGGMP